MCIVYIYYNIYCISSCSGLPREFLHLNLFAARSSPQEKSMVFANVGKDGSRICPGLEQGASVDIAWQWGGIATRCLVSRKFEAPLGLVQFKKTLAGMNLALDTCVGILRA